MHQQTSSRSFSLPTSMKRISHSSWIGGDEIILLSIVIHTRKKRRDFERFETRGDRCNSGGTRHHAPSLR